MEQSDELPAREWWRRRRVRYNACLLAALLLGFLANLFVLDFRTDASTPTTFSIENGVSPLPDNDIGGASVILPCCSSVIYLLFGNAAYSLGAGSERFFGIDRLDIYRKRMWLTGTLFSCALPFCIAVFNFLKR